MTVSYSIIYRDGTRSDDVLIFNDLSLDWFRGDLGKDPDYWALVEEVKTMGGRVVLRRGLSGELYVCVSLDGETLLVEEAPW